MRQYPNIWTTKVLVPCWIPQWMCLMIFFVVSLRLLTAVGEAEHGDAVRVSYYGYDKAQLIDGAAILAGVLLGVTVATMAMNITEAWLYRKQTFSPKLALVFACLKTTVWLGSFILLITSAAMGSFSVLGFVLTMVLGLTSVVQLVFASIYTHRIRTQKAYNIVNNHDASHVDV
ncbi:hypothetical protein BX600DRAFT_447564 [Xylariales sp. PMI_506]|nr:hypothetical protein BX600DRAFT_447564 [Xylariales sp. PMI_506]